MKKFRVARESDDGFTLIELMVSGLLGVLVISVVAGIMFSSTNTEGLVRNVSVATEAGQSLTNSLERGIRNSAYKVGTLQSVRVLNVGSDQLVTALTVGSGSAISASCSAWYYSAATHSVRFFSWPSGAIVAPTLAALSSWKLLSTGVSPVTGDFIFTLDGPTTLSFAFNEDAGKDPAIPFQSTVASRTAITGSTACF